MGLVNGNDEARQRARDKGCTSGGAGDEKKVVGRRSYVARTCGGNETGRAAERGGQAATELLGQAVGQCGLDLDLDLDHHIPSRLHGNCSEPFYINQGVSRLA